MGIKLDYDTVIKVCVEMLLKQEDVLHACDIFESIMTDAIRGAINTAYTKVFIINSNPSETRREITDKYKFKCIWEGTPGSCGRITVYVPKDKCTKALLDDFRKYDPKLGAVWDNDPCMTYPTVD